jgi:hypothetical protein
LDEIEDEIDYPKRLVNQHNLKEQTKLILYHPKKKTEIKKELNYKKNNLDYE